MSRAEDRNYDKYFCALVIALIISSSFGFMPHAAFALPYTIAKTQSGIVAIDPLNNETQAQQQVLSDHRYWTYYGTAVSEKNTAYYAYKDSQGLHIGEPGPNDQVYGAGSYSGYYAVSPDSNALLVHAVLTATNTPVASYDFQNQIEIMPSSGSVNYITCGAVTNSDGTYWEVVHGYGSGVEADHWVTLWEDTSANQPLTRDCTVITNGQNYLKVYMDNSMVYSSTTLSLNMPQPLDYYLQTMNSESGVTHYGTYRDYYLTTDEKIQVTGNPPNAATVSLVDSSGNTLASSAVSSGTATINIGKYHFPIDATIRVSDANNNILASSPASIYGGDVFSVSQSGSTSTVPQQPAGLAAHSSSSRVDLTWTAPADNGGSPITNYNIYRGTSSGSETPYTQTGNVTGYADTAVTNGQTYFYIVTAVNSVGESSQSSEVSATPTASATVPGAPTSLTASPASPSQINLSWSAPSSNGGSAITGYKIDRSPDGGTTWSTIAANTNSASTTYSDTGLAATTTYAYRVSAINGVGTGAPSNIASATTTSTTSSGIALNGVKSTSGTVSPSNQITISNFNAGTGINRLLVVGVSANNEDVASVTFGGVPLTQAVSSFYNNDAEFWYLANPSGTGNVVVTMNGPTQAVMGAYSFSGVDQTTPVPTHVAKHNTVPNSPNISITTKYPNDFVLDLPSIYGGSTLGSPTCTQQWDANIAGAITGASSSEMVASPGLSTCSWAASGGGDLWDDVAIELKSSG